VRRVTEDAIKRDKSAQATRYFLFLTSGQDTAVNRQLAQGLITWKAPGVQLELAVMGVLGGPAISSRSEAIGKCKGVDDLNFISRDEAAKYLSKPPPEPSRENVDTHFHTHFVTSQGE
jgi:hypothetical protein